MNWVKQSLSSHDLAYYVLTLFVCAAIFAALTSMVWAIFCKSKDLRRQLLRGSGISFLVVLLLFGSHFASYYAFRTGPLASLAVALCAVAAVVMAIGILISLFSLVHAIVWIVEPSRSKAVRRSLLGFVLFGSALVPLFANMLVRGMTKSDNTNYPGTLTKIGGPAPEFKITDIDGTQFRSADCRGKLLLVNFFATWCVPCRLELPHLQKVWKQYGDRDDFRMLMIGKEQSDATIKAFAQKHSLTFPLAADSQGTVFAQFASEYIPRTYLIARNGRIIFQSTGFFDDDFARLKILLKTELGPTSGEN